MSTRIVAAQAEHAVAIGTMIHDMLDIFLAGSDVTARTAFFNSYLSASAIALFLTDVQHDYYVIETDNRDVIGVIGLYNARHIRHLFVARDHHGHGYARQLWTYALHQMLNKLPTNEPFTVNSSLYAIPTYRAFGFAGKEKDMCSEQGIEYLPMKRPALPEK